MNNVGEPRCDELAMMVEFALGRLSGRTSAMNSCGDDQIG